MIVTTAEIATQALDIANESARELLTTEWFNRYLPLLDINERHVLSREWTPFIVYESRYEAGLQLAPDADIIVAIFLRDPELSSQLYDIGDQAIAGQILTSEGLTSILQSLKDDHDDRSA